MVISSSNLPSPRGRAALLMTRGHARQVMQLLGTEETLASFEEVEAGVTRSTLSRV